MTAQSILAAVLDGLVANTAVQVLIVVRLHVTNAFKVAAEPGAADIARERLLDATTTRFFFRLVFACILALTVWVVMRGCLAARAAGRRDAIGLVRTRNLRVLRLQRRFRERQREQHRRCLLSGFVHRKGVLDGNEGGLGYWLRDYGLPRLLLRDLSSHKHC